MKKEEKNLNEKISDFGNYKISDVCFKTYFKHISKDEQLNELKRIVCSLVLENENLQKENSELRHLIGEIKISNIEAQTKNKKHAKRNP